MCKCNCAQKQQPPQPVKGKNADTRIQSLIDRGELVLKRRMTKANYETLGKKLGVSPKYAQWLVTIYRRLNGAWVTKTKD